MDASARHIPVLLAEVLGALGPRDGDVIVDGTFGAGGYSSAVLDAAQTRVIAIDRDPTAISGGQGLLAQYGARLSGRFRAEEMRAALGFIVLFVGIQMGLDLFVRPSELFLLAPGIGD